MLVINNNEDVENMEHFRLCNRDLAAYLNMLHIVRSLRENSQIPESFKHDVP
jgi:hypothetical protein